MEEEIKKILKNDKKELFITSNSTSDTISIGYTIAKYCDNDLVLGLNGELGSGKTIFVTGFAKYFKIENEVSSPTFTLVNEYSNNIFHFDVYRIKDENEFLNNIGEDYLSQGICIIEWASIIENILPKRTIFIDIKKDESDSNRRLFHIWRR